MTPKPEVPPLTVTGGNGRYMVRCAACGLERQLLAKKADVHKWTEAHRRNRKLHPKLFAGNPQDALELTDSIGVELTTEEASP